MNALELWMSTQFRTERAIMNELQEAGIVSDNAVYAADVCDGDAEKAAEWLKDN